MGWGERGGEELGAVMCRVRILDVCKRGDGGDMRKGEQKSARDLLERAEMFVLCAALPCCGGHGLPRYP